jgi:hypothetical protein
MLSIKNAALINKVINVENKRISFFKIYPPTLKFSVKNNTSIIIRFKINFIDYF